jgi:phosphatidylinositol glycan class B
MLTEKSTLSTFRICLAVSILLHIIVSILSIGYHHGDEHYQILEFAGLKLGFNNPVDLAWEYHYKMRPALQPFFAVIMIKFFNALSLTDPFFQAIIFRMLSSILSIVSIVVFIQAFIDDLTNETLKKWLIVMSFLLWIIVYTDVRFSSEGWSASFLTLGIALLKIYLDGKVNKKTVHLLFTGFVIGLSFVCRYQTAFFILGLGLWLIFINKTKILPLTYILIGGSIALSIGVLIDSWFYETFTFTPLNYFTQNILENKASNYGVSPWWYYITNTIKDGVIFFGLLSILSFIIIVIKNPTNIFVWSIVPFLIIHSIVGHKEARFLFPIIKFAPYIVLFSFTLLEKYRPIINFATSKLVFYIIIIANSILTIAHCFTPADYSTGVINYIYHEYSGKEKVKLYYLDNNPYENFGLYNNYYKSENIKYRKIKNLSQIKFKNGEEILLVASDKKIIRDTSNISFQKVYQSVPELLANNMQSWAPLHTMKVLYKCSKVTVEKK